jgi:hypothetical protein
LYQDVGIEYFNWYKLLTTGDLVTNSLFTCEPKLGKKMPEEINSLISKGTEFKDGLKALVDKVDVGCRSNAESDHPEHCYMFSPDQKHKFSEGVENVAKARDLNKIDHRLKKELAVRGEKNSNNRILKPKARESRNAGMRQVKLAARLRGMAIKEEGIVDNNEGIIDGNGNYGGDSIIGGDTVINGGSDKMMGYADEGMDEDVNMADCKGMIPCLALATISPTVALETGLTIPPNLFCSFFLQRIQKRFYQDSTL